jgi:hypothetical protein
MVDGIDGLAGMLKPSDFFASLALLFYLVKQPMVYGCLAVLYCRNFSLLGV